MSNSMKYECPGGGKFHESFGGLEHCADCIISEPCRTGDNREVTLTQPEFKAFHHCTMIKTNELIVLNAYNGAGIIIKQAHVCTGCEKRIWENVQRMDEFDFVAKVKKGEL